MIPEGTQPPAVTGELAKQVIDQVKAYQSGHPKLSIGTIARAVGYASSVISQVLNSKYAGDWRGVIIDVDRWLDAQIKRDAAPKEAEFVWTSVAKEMKTIADVAVNLRTIGLVYGPETSGIGKTMALHAIARETPASILITIDQVAANPTGILAAIARELRVGCGSNRLTFERIKGVLKDTPRLLLIDQIHNLCESANDRAFYVLADLHDATNNAPQLWCGTSDIVAHLDRGQAKGKAPLAQIRRRIGVRRDLMQRTRPKGEGGNGEPLYSIQEIRDVFGQDKMRLAPDAARYLFSLANLLDCGALGTCSNIVKIATTIAKTQGEKVLTEHLCRAAGTMLLESKAVQLIEARMSEQTPLQLKAG